MATTKSSPLDEIRTATGDQRGKCKYCTEDATVHVEVRVRERGGKKGQITSKSASTCELHAVALFRDIEKQIDKKRP